MKKLTSQEKGIFYLPHSLPCTESLPKASFTEWLRLDDPASVVAIVEIAESDDPNAKKTSERMTFQTGRKEKTNKQWLENEKERCEKKHPTTIYKIVLSSCKQFGCLCKYSKSYAKRKNL
jgi:hypothetical protein